MWTVRISIKKPEKKVPSPEATAEFGMQILNRSSPLLFKKSRSKKKFMEVAYPHLDLLYNVAFRLTGNRYDAEDLTQETFATALDKFHQLRELDRCKYWLLTILRNHFLRGVEKRRPELLDVPDDLAYASILESLVAEGDPETLFLKKTAATEVQSVLNALPEKYKLPIILFYTEGWAYKGIAEGLELSLGTVMSRLSRGRELMKKEILRRRRAAKAGKLITANFSRSARKG